jgi:hypothetical protein
VIAVRGIEMTQAIQYFGWQSPFGAEGSGFGPDNSVPLVPLKDTLLRVYVDCSSTPQFPRPNQVTGTITLQPPNQPTITLSPSPPNTPGLAASERSRGTLGHTLNFFLPAGLCRGTLTFTLRLHDPTRPSQLEYESEPFNFGARFEPVRFLEVVLVLMGYVGPLTPGGGQFFVAPPSLPEVEQTLANAVQAYPTPWYSLLGVKGEASSVTFEGDLTLNSSDGRSWRGILDRLASLRSGDGEEFRDQRIVYLAVLSSGLASTSTVAGLGRGTGVAAVIAGGNGSFMQHEIAHALGRLHAPFTCLADPRTLTDVDSRFPPYPSGPGTIGEFGVDLSVSPPLLLNPTSTFDFMTVACGPSWISPYHYVAIKYRLTPGSVIKLVVSAAASGSPEEVSTAASGSPETEQEMESEYLYLRFRMHRDGKVDLRPSFLLPTRNPDPQDTGPPSPVSVDLLDAEGEIIVSQFCHANVDIPYYRDPEESHDPYEAHLYFYEAIRWYPGVKTIVFLRRNEEVDRIEVEEEPPETGTPRVEEQEGNRRRIRWGGPEERDEEEGVHDERDGEDHIAYWLRYSHDGGDTWQAVAADLSEPYHDVDLGLLPGGERCVFQVIASAGIRTAVAETEPLSAPQKPRQAYILSPEPGAAFGPEQGVVLKGGGFSPDFRMPEFDSVVWTSNIDGFIGTGYKVVMRVPSAGRHRITLSIPDALGGEATASVYVTINPSEYPR